ncbi:phospholipase D-like domain-containing protein, partial [Lactobacillus delbrueckii subsp. bulgaricus]
LNFNQDFQVHWVNMSSNFKNIMHTKFCIIDLSKVMEGSYNLTNAANYNKETLNIFTGKNMVSMYADEFVTLKKKASS